VSEKKLITQVQLDAAIKQGQFDASDKVTEEIWNSLPNEASNRRCGVSDEGTRALIDIDDYKIKLDEVLAEKRRVEARVKELEDGIRTAMLRFCDEGSSKMMEILLETLGSKPTEREAK